MLSLKYLDDFYKEFLKPKLTNNILINIYNNLYKITTGERISSNGIILKQLRKSCQ